jgi:hypothetical protein
MNTLLAGLLPALLDIAMLLVTALAGWLAARAARWLNLQNEEALRRPLVDLVDTMAQAVRVRFGGVSMTHELVERMVPDLAAHVERSYPERVRALGVERPSLENMIRVRLGVGPMVRP